MTGAGKALRHTVQIEDAGALATRLNQQAVVIVGVARDGTVTVVTYGETKAKCVSIGEWGQGLWRNAIAAVPFQTMFGWGNHGTPKPLSVEEFGSLSEAGKTFARRHAGEPSLKGLRPLTKGPLAGQYLALLTPDSLLAHTDGRTGTFVAVVPDGRLQVQSLKGKGFWTFAPEDCEYRGEREAAALG